MAYLEVPGATLYYEVVGHGPMLLCITGALGSVEPFRGLAECLKSHFTVVMYDRRGYSRSLLSGTEAQDYDRRMETDADDASLLIKHISPDTTATVLGSSSGALVAFELLIRHPDIIQTLIAHEPPAHTLLPNFAEISAGSHELYKLYRRFGIPPALEMFAKAIKLGAEAPLLMQSFDPRSGPYVFSNAQYWFERELGYVTREFDIEILGASKAKLVLAVGELSNKEAGQYRPNVVLSQKLGLQLVAFPGGHLGLASHPEEFAERLMMTLPAP